MFHKNKLTNLLLHIVLILLILIVLLSFINIYASVKYFDYMTNLSFDDDINLIEYNNNNFSDPNEGLYEPNFTNTVYDSPYTTPNELGEIMIVMYHGVDESIPDTNVYHRSVHGFKEDLQRIYDYNYYIISLNDYLNNEINVPFGYTPIVLTFDDGLGSSFSMEYDENDVLVPKEDCAVDILNKYRVEYDRPNATATFFINTINPPFYGFGTPEERINYLIDNGYDIGNHTYSHALMENMTPEEIQKEIALTEQFVKEIRPEYEMVALAYPYGGRPPTQYLDYTLNGTYEDITYSYKIGLMASSTNNTTNINSIYFDPLKVPRVRGTDTSNYDLGWYFEYYNEHPEYRYISDGDKDTITIPADAISNLNEEVLDNKQVVIID